MQGGGPPRAQQRTTPYSVITPAHPSTLPSATSAQKSADGRLAPEANRYRPPLCQPNGAVAAVAATAPAATRDLPHVSLGMTKQQKATLAAQYAAFRGLQKNAELLPEDWAKVRSCWPAADPPHLRGKAVCHNRPPWLCR